MLVRQLMKIVQNKIKERHAHKESEFWITRPLDCESLDYAYFDVVQLRVLYNYYSPSLSKYRYIMQESKRYVEIHKEQLRSRGSTYWDHGVLPQEILERSPATQIKYDGLGTKQCGGCDRELHQDSFECRFNGWRRGQLCYTCAEAKRYKDIRKYEEIEAANELFWNNHVLWDDEQDDWDEFDDYLDQETSADFEFFGNYSD
jgi:hypothetical protein